jgi:hypothetical protein
MFGFVPPRVCALPSLISAFLSDCAGASSASAAPTVTGAGEVKKAAPAAAEDEDEVDAGMDEGEDGTWSPSLACVACLHLERFVTAICARAALPSFR